MKALLAVGLSNEAMNSLGHLLAGEGWQVYSSSGWMQVFLRLRERLYQAVLCGASLPDGDWRDTLDELRLCTDPPPLIVTSRLAHPQLRIEVLDAGGYDVLPYPFEGGELARMLEQAAARKWEPLSWAPQLTSLSAVPAATIPEEQPVSPTVGGASTAAMRSVSSAFARAGS